MAQVVQAREVQLGEAGGGRGQEVGVCPQWSLEPLGTEKTLCDIRRWPPLPVREGRGWARRRGRKGVRGSKVGEVDGGSSRGRWRLDRDGPGAGTGRGHSHNGPGVTALGQLRPC